MRAIMVSVDYTDLLSIILPWNRHHFEEVTIVTSSADHRNVLPLAVEHDCRLVVTDLFYERGAAFNKFAALEHGLDVMGRKGWLCVMDADVLWPRTLRVWAGETELHIDDERSTTPAVTYHPGQLITPLRRMLDNVALWPAYQNEASWSKLPLHRNVGEHAGYSQIFHASDPVLGPPPWHETCYEHAGTADSLFQRKWPAERKVRPPFEVLHLGPAGQNWMGRATPRVDGSVPPEAGERLGKVRRIWTTRRRLEGEGVRGDERFREERLPPS